VPTPPLQTGSRVLLRRPVEADRHAYTDAVERSREAHQPWIDHAPRENVFEKFLERSDRCDSEALLVCARENADLAGVLNLSQIFYGPFESAYLSYYAFSGFEGTGYMSEGLQLLFAHAFHTLGLHRLEANIQPGNARSIALVRRAGFRKEGLSLRYLRIGGVWRDHERWAILREEWEPRLLTQHSIEREAVARHSTGVRA